MARSLKEDVGNNLQIDFEFEDENNMQLLDFSSENLERENKEYWEELLNDNNECIFYDDSNVNEIFDADIQSNNEEVENFSPDFYGWALCKIISHKALNEILYLLLNIFQIVFYQKMP